ncbi:MAG: TonB-dependent receptor plug domain-containing protein, partial [Pseudoxanthomonas sp.]
MTSDCSDHLLCLAVRRSASAEAHRIHRWATELSRSAGTVWHTPGAHGGSYGNDSRSDWLLLRGFTAARYLDGLALAEGSRTGINRAEPSGLENIEVLKGPSSVSYGAMPGGLVNYVSKRPTEEG